jgi:predicted nucleotidyltransferase
MKREKAIEKLKRMLQLIDGGELPIAPLAFYVFGSVARGALEPHDLDVIVVLELDKSEPTDGRSIEEFLRIRAEREAQAKSLLRRQGGRCDLIWAYHFEDINNDNIKNNAVLLWASDDRDWSTKLAAMKVNPAAERFQRNHFFPIKRLQLDLGDMNWIMAMQDHEQLTITHIPVNSANIPKVSKYHGDLLSRWNELDERWREAEAEWAEQENEGGRWRISEVFGKKTWETVPWALTWLTQERVRADRHVIKCVIRTKKKSHVVLLGKPSPRLAVCMLHESPKLKKVCLIPQFHRDGPNELLVFERGRNWPDDPFSV